MTLSKYATVRTTTLLEPEDSSPSLLSNCLFPQDKTDLEGDDWTDPYSPYFKDPVHIGQGLLQQDLMLPQPIPSGVHFLTIETLSTSPCTDQGILSASGRPAPASTTQMRAVRQCRVDCLTHLPNVVPLIPTMNGIRHIGVSRGNDGLIAGSWDSLESISILLDAPSCITSLASSPSFPSLPSIAWTGSFPSFTCSYSQNLNFLRTSSQQTIHISWIQFW